jgi:hypothetical protein
MWRCVICGIYSGEFSYCGPLWFMTPCSLVDGQKHFGETYFYHLQDKIWGNIFLRKVLIIY